MKENLLDKYKKRQEDTAKHKGVYIISSEARGKGGEKEKTAGGQQRRMGGSGGQGRRGCGTEKAKRNGGGVYRNVQPAGVGRGEIEERRGSRNDPI